MHINDCNINKETHKASGYMSILYHNKGIDTVNLPRILNTKCVRDAVPSCVQNVSPPIVSFKYTKTIAGRILNQNKVVEGLEVNALPPIVSFKYTKTIAGRILNQNKVVEGLDVN